MENQKRNLKNNIPFIYININNLNFSFYVSVPLKINFHWYSNVWMKFKVKIKIIIVTKKMIINTTDICDKYMYFWLKKRKNKFYE